MQLKHVCSFPSNELWWAPPNNCTLPPHRRILCRTHRSGGAARGCILIKHCGTSSLRPTGLRKKNASLCHHCTPRPREADGSRCQMGHVGAHHPHQVRLKGRRVLRAHVVKGGARGPHNAVLPRQQSGPRRRCVPTFRSLFSRILSRSFSNPLLVGKSTLRRRFTNAHLVPGNVAGLFTRLFGFLRVGAFVWRLISDSHLILSMCT
jgi:hypothetical protein